MRATLPDPGTGQPAFRAALLLRAFAALMLMVIGLQATPAQPLPTIPAHGSAFSASTADVALAVRREVAAEVRVVAAPAWPVRPMAVPPALAASLARPEVWPAHRQTGPPVLPRPPRWQPAPRAPPHNA